MADTAINLYSVRDLDEPTLDILDRVADAGYDGVQFAGEFGDATAGEVADAVADLGLDVVPPHVGIDVLEDELDRTLEAYRDVLGCDGAVVPYLGEEHFESREAVDETATRLSTLADELADHDWALHYHNHAHEFVDLEGESAYERFVRESDVRLELDVGWALVGGSDPVGLIEAYGDRIDLLHMKDMATDEERGFREIGEGDVDMAACADAGRDAGVDWFVYEHDEPEDPARSLETGAAYLDEL